MAIFADSEPAAPVRRRRTWIGWTLVAIAVVGVITVALLPSSYVIEKPGPVYDTLGSVQVSGKDVPLIDIPSGTKQYATTGSLDMLTVTIAGTREQPESWLDTVIGWLTPSDNVLPVDDVYPKGVTVQQSNEQGAVDMQNSQKEAVAAALTDLGYDFSSTLTVDSVLKGSPADGQLKKGDVVTAVNGERFSDVSALRGLIKKNGTDAAAAIDIVRASTKMTLHVTPVLSPASQGTPRAPILGVTLSSEYDFPIDVKIQLENVGGPSAGQMFALGIIDKLTPGSLTGGARVAGTGTITGAGDVGAIGGIRQKMYGAKNAGATYFLAPKSNCDEVVGHVPSGLTVFAVSTLSDSLAALKAVSSGASTASLPTCTAG
ncbi:PDZ domain-containing protein [soil metagenome]